MYTKLLSYFSLLSIACLLNHEVSAQFQGKVYEPFNDAKVLVDGVEINAAWCGGINSVQINHADLNQDGKSDLVLYDHNNYIIKTFLNIGNSGEIKYQYEPKFEKNFPAIYNYLILKDYNCDGIPDLFHKGIPGVSVFTGYYQSGELKFNYYKDLYFPGTFGMVNVFVQPDDIPSIIDVDNDGDLDVVAFGINGAYLQLTKNISVEQGLPCDSMRMEFVDNCYGKFFQSVDRTSILGITCKGVAGSNKTRHTGNCFVLLDIEGDNDLDFLGGNISFSDAQLLVNSGTSAMANYTSQDTTYNHANHILKMPTWPAPFHVDIDNDGDKDILFTSHNDNSFSADYNSVAFYKNAGTDATPNFLFQHDSLLTPDMIDVGSYSYPTFFDYDKDGKKDLFVGCEGRLINDNQSRKSQIAYYRNTSTSTNVSFELMTKDFLNLSTLNYPGIFPTFGDLTGDGIIDLVLGNTKGYITVYKNYTSSNSLVPNFSLLTDSMSGITVGKNSAPLVYDFNQDGKTDLLVGNQTGKITYYQDTSSTSVKKLALQTVSLGNFKAGDVSNLYGYCVPFIGKMDNTEKEYLLIGNTDGTIARYDNFINNLGTFTRIDSNYSEIKTLTRSVPAIDDLNGDGKYEMVVGSKLGGLSYFKQVKVVVGIPETVDLQHSFVLYPNPTSDGLHILFNDYNATNQMEFMLMDLSGKQLLVSHLSATQLNTIDISSFCAGMYLAVIIDGDKKVVKKVIKSDK